MARSRSLKSGPGPRVKSNSYVVRDGAGRKTFSSCSMPAGRSTLSHERIAATLPRRDEIAERERYLASANRLFAQRPPTAPRERPVQ